jgi:anti-anti-sigma factor
MSAPLAFGTHTDNGTTIVRVGEGIFADNREPLLAALLQLADTPRACIVIDLTDVPLCDSSALNMFVQVHQRATATSGQLRLANPQPMVRRILHITNLDQLIPIHPELGDGGEG